MPKKTMKLDLSVLDAKLPTKQAALSIEIPELNIGMMSLTLVGDSPLLMNKFSEKSKEQMEGAQTGKAVLGKKGRAPKDPIDCFLRACHTVGGPATLVKKGGQVYAKGNFIFPGGGFKKSAVRAAQDVGLKMTDMRRVFHVMQDDVPIISKSLPKMVRHTVRIGQGKTDLRYRPQFDSWSVKLNITYNASVITPAQIANLFNGAGFGVGIGEWRPERSGSFGMFHVASKAGLIGKGKA